VVQPDPVADAEAIRALVARWHAATAAGDVEAIRPLMTEDAIFLAAGAPPLAGRETFLDALRGVLARMRIESSGQVREVEVRGDLAWARSDLVVRMRPRDGGTAVTRTGPVLSVFRRDAGGAWQLHRDANLLGRPDDPPASTSVGAVVDPSA
jgi:uncharacterized protein (TIGR02246 family)